MHRHFQGRIRSSALVRVTLVILDKFISLGLRLFISFLKSSNKRNIYGNKHSYSFAFMLQKASWYLMWNALIDAQYNRLLLLQELFKMIGRKFDWDCDSI